MVKRVRKFLENCQTNANISKEKIVNFIIAMPPLEEQKRIVTKIDELFKIIDEKLNI